MVIRDAIACAVERLSQAGVDDARRDAWLLLGHVRRQERAALLADALEWLGVDDQRDFWTLVDRRAQREPLAQIIGRKEFWSLDLLVTADVLCPRPDSECLIQAALNEASRRFGLQGDVGPVLDLGTGSGCLLLALLSEWPSASGLGVDISPDALSIASANGEQLGLAGRASWLCSDWGAALHGQFRTIVSNPPYIAAGESAALAPEIREFEPSLALFAGKDGLDAYRRLTSELQRLLAPDGFACLEIGFDQADAVEIFLKEAGFTTRERCTDLAGKDRCLVVQHGGPSF